MNFRPIRNSGEVSRRGRVAERRALHFPRAVIRAFEFGDDDVRLGGHSTDGE
jgi:hypothetical protein